MTTESLTHTSHRFRYGSMGAIAGLFVPDPADCAHLSSARLGSFWHTISEWAIGRNGWMMSAAFLISARQLTRLYS